MRILNSVALRRVAPAGLLMLVLAGCGGRASGVMVPVGGSAPGTSRVEMIVATTRQQLPDDTGELFSGERSPKLGFVDVAVSIPPDSVREIGEVQWPEKVPGNPAKDFVTTKANIIDLPTARSRFAELLKVPKNKGRALVFVHGYNTKFEDAVMRFAQIVHDSGSPGVPVLFTWPSRAKLLAYTYDRESGNYSRDSLEALLAALSANPQVNEIGILAHSMGNWVTLEALRTMALKNGRIHPKIQNVMLAAPDVDVDVFRTQMQSLGPKRPNITLFVSQDDKALKFSRSIWGDVPRLGAIDPEAEPYKTSLAKENITVIDLTKLKSEDRLGHGKFAEVPEIVQMIGKRMSTGQSMHDDRSGLGERLANSASELGAGIGRTAGHVITAPVTILEGKR